jgi:Transposase DDE domain
VQPAPSQLDALAPTMRFVQRLKLGRPTVHIIDREADSVAHYRQWSRHRWLFLVRADAQRVVRHEGQERSLSEVVASLHRGGAFRPSRTVRYHGRPAEQLVAEAAVVLERPAAPNRRGAGGGPRRPVRGAKLPLRLVVSEVRDGDGALLATWLLLTNAPASVPAGEVALWYYWRWRVESYFKLLKGAGLHLEQWQQETARALAKRLLVASMACVVVWRVARSEAPEAAQVRRLLVRLSGRQMKWGVEFTEPALLAGLWVLLSMMRLLEHEDPDSLLRMAQSVLPTSEPPGEPQHGAV